MTAYCIITSVDLGEYSGVQEFVRDLTDFVISHGHEATVISSKNVFPLFSVQKFKPGANAFSTRFIFNSQVTTHSSNIMVGSMLSFILKTAATIDQCGRHKISLIHAQDIFFSGFAGVVAHKLFRIPLVVHAHGPSPYFSSSDSETTHFKKTLAKLLARFVVQNSDLILATDDQTRKLIRIFAGSVQVLCIPTPIRVNNYLNKSEDEEEIKDKYTRGLVLGTIGRLSPQKNLRTLLRVFAAIRNEVVDSRLIIVGNGPQKDSLVDEVGRLGLNDSVLLVGSVIENEKIKFLESFDIFVMPSIYEGCPIALLEAMASGKAVVASNIPAIKEIVRSGDEAILVNPYDEEDLRKSILLLVNEPSLRSSLGHKARERAKNYDINIVFDQLMGLYEELVRNA
jgi:glycosyltransferase involved in cell wall biosynthesis